jgi:hypothetical protein
VSGAQSEPKEWAEIRTKDRNILRILREARAKVERPEAWAQRARARDRDGAVVSPLGSQPVSCCVLGAIDAVDPRSGVREKAGAALLAQIQSGDLASWNDWSRRKHDDVLALFDRAIVEEIKKLEQRN